MNGGMIVMGVCLVLFPILLAWQIYGETKPLTWLATQIAHADYAEGQGELELHAKKRMIDIRLDEMEILNKRLAEIQGQLHEDEKWWDTNCGVVTFLAPGLGQTCNDVRTMRYSPAFGSLGGEQQEIKNRLRELESEILRIQKG